MPDDKFPPRKALEVCMLRNTQVQADLIAPKPKPKATPCQ